MYCFLVCSITSRLAKTSNFRIIHYIDFEVSGRVWKVNIKLDTLFDAMSDTDRWVCMFSSWSKHQSNSSKVSTAVRIYVSSSRKWNERFYISCILLRIFQIIVTSMAFIKRQLSYQVCSIVESWPPWMAFGHVDSLCWRKEK